MTFPIQILPPNFSITSNTVEELIKDTYIFNDVFYLCIIKASPKSDMAVIWVDIWDSQKTVQKLSVLLIDVSM